MLINVGVKSLQRFNFSSCVSAVCVLHLSAEGGNQADMVAVLQSYKYYFCCCKLYFINFILSENIILMTVSQFTLIFYCRTGLEDEATNDSY